MMRKRPLSLFQLGLIILVMSFGGRSALIWADVFMEDFQSNLFIDNERIGTHVQWHDDDSGPRINDASGVKTLDHNDTIYVWKNHNFCWETMAVGEAVVISMDFQSSSSALFDDDRCAWTTENDSTSSSNILAVQIDTNQLSGIHLYYRNGGNPNTPTIATFSLDPQDPDDCNAWFRLTAQFIKITNSSAEIIAKLERLDTNGNPTELIASGTIADTSNLTPAPEADYFEGTLYPAFKNGDNVSGQADNAYFETGIGDISLDWPKSEEIISDSTLDLSCTAVDLEGLASAQLYMADITAPTTLAAQTGTTNVIDAQLRQNDPEENFDGDYDEEDEDDRGKMTVDGEYTSENASHCLMGFPHLFTTEGGSIPPGSIILSANLSFTVFDEGSFFEIYTVTEEWDENSVTWNSQPEYDMKDFILVESESGTNTVDITSMVQDWSNGVANNGLIFVSTGTNGVDIYQSEYTTNTSLRPVLNITYKPLTAVGSPVSLSGLEDTATFADVSLTDGHDYAWNCKITNSNSLSYFAAGPQSFSVDEYWPALIGPEDGAEDVGTNVVLQLQVDDPQDDDLTVTFYEYPEDFSIVVLPDTQKYVDGSQDSLHIDDLTPDLFYQQTDWIANNIDTYNIVFVSHEGDLAEHDSVDNEWLKVDAAMDLLDTVVPYGVLPGNHDQPISDYNTYFSSSRFSGYPWYGGYYTSNNVCSYQLISAGDVDLLFLHMGMAEEAMGSTGNLARLNWARGILNTYPNRHAIITTHGYLAADADRDPHTFGDTTPMWNYMTQPISGTTTPENVFLMLCGHVHAENRRTDMVNGRPVHQLLADYQDDIRGGDGYLRIMTFQPSKGKILVQTYSPYRDIWQTDENSLFELDFDMGTPQVIGSVTVSSGSVAECVWNGLDTDTDYQWFAVVSDGSNETTTPAYQFTTGGGTIHNTTKDLWYTDIQSALNGADTGTANTIVVSPGTYVGDISMPNKPITLTSTDPQDEFTVAATIIQGNASSPVTFSSLTYSPILSGFTITDSGSYPDNSNGGGIYISSASPTISYCTITNCEADDGGAVYSNGGNATFNYCTFINNSAGMTGGAISLSGMGTTTVMGCTFDNNEATYYAGGIVTWLNATLDLKSSLFTNNTAGWHGGALYCSPSYVMVKNCTMVNNDAGIDGGGIYSYTSNIEVHNSIIWDNTAPSGSAIATSSISPMEINYCCIDKSEITGSFVGDEGNIGLDPLFVDETAGDYRLQLDSPCLDTGDWDTLSVAYDINGEARIQGYLSDMGAYETPIEYSQTVHNETTDNWHSTIASAISAATAGDVIRVYPGTYNESLTIDKNIRIAGVGPRGIYTTNHTCISGEYSNRVIEFSTGLTNDCVLAGVKIRYGSASNGGGIYCNNTNPVIEDCIMNGNYASSGGGAIYISNCSPVINHCHIGSNNQASSGAGVYLINGSPTFTDTKFVYNYASYSGGGVYAYGTGSPLFTNCYFGYNTGGYGGGGINLQSMSPTLTNCIFYGNSATDGGAVMNAYASTLSYINCSFSNNSATGSRNSGRGGAIYNVNSNPTITNCILWGDSATQTPAEIYNYGSTPVVTYCDVQGGYTGTGNVNTDPLFTGLTTFYPFFSANYLQLQSSSPVKDSGFDNAVPGGIDTDYFGNDRFVSTVGMGAMEVQN